MTQSTKGLILYTEGMKSRQTQESDIDDILNIYSTIERKTPASNLEGWSLSEVRQQFLYWIRRDEYISILSELKARVHIRSIP